MDSSDMLRLKEPYGLQFYSIDFKIWSPSGRNCLIIEEI